MQVYDYLCWLQIRNGKDWDWISSLCIPVHKEKKMAGKSDCRIFKR